MADPQTQTDEPLWYKDAIIYELHVKSFFDSNGDGIGDFEGVIHKLDYLQELGVTALWLLPFYPSPLLDDGYDIADYFHINPDYGTLADFKQLLREAHRRDIRIITELVINHTSEPARMVSAVPAGQARLALAGLLRLERHDRQVPRRADHLHRLRELQLGLGPRRPGLLLAPVLQSSARPELRQPAGPPRDPPRAGLLVQHGR